MNIKQTFFVLLLPILFASTSVQTNPTAMNAAQTPVNIHVHTTEQSSWLPTLSFKNVVVGSIVMGGGYYAYQYYKKNNELIKKLRQEVRDLQRTVDANGKKLDVIGSFLLYVHATRVSDFATLSENTQDQLETLFRPIEKPAKELINQSSSFIRSSWNAATSWF